MEEFRTSYGRDFILTTGNANPELAQKVGDLLGVEAHLCCSKFEDGCTNPILPHVRDYWVFILQPTGGPPNPNDNLIEVAAIARAAKNNGAEKVIAVVPYVANARSDRPDRKRTAIMVDLEKSVLHANGVDEIITMDIHSEQSLSGEEPRPIDNLYASSVLVPAIQAAQLPNLMVVSPDHGAEPRAKAYGRLLGVPLSKTSKERDDDDRNQVYFTPLTKDVRGANVCIVDDVTATFGTLDGVVNLAMESGAEDVRALLAHGIFVGPALERINRSEITEIYVTDSVFLKPEVLTNPKIRVVSCAPLIGDAITVRLTPRASMSALHDKLYPYPPLSRLLASIA